MATAKKRNKKDAQTLALANGIAPDFEAMRKAAEILGVEPPAGEGEVATRELLGALRMKMRELLKPVPVDQQLVCQKCGERSTDATDFCPFCGDAGIAEEEADLQPAAATGIAETEQAAPAVTVDVEAKLAELGTELDDRLAKLNELKRSFVATTYDMGVLVKEIHDKQLFKARGYDSFKAFAEKELPFARTTAYHMISVVERFDRKTYNEIGFKRLRTIASVDDTEERARLVEEAKSGASSREIDQKVSAGREKKTSTKRGTAPVVEAKTASTPAPAAEKRPVTVLGTVDDKPRAVTFKSAKTGLELKSAAKVTMMDADAYAEIEVSEGVFIQIALRVEGKDLTGVTAKFVRAAAAAE